MKFDEPGNSPPCPDRVRNAGWFSWQDHDRTPQPVRRNGQPSGEPSWPASGPCLVSGNCAGETLTPERIAALRQWIAAGGHNAPDVAEEVARRLLDRGELTG